MVYKKSEDDDKVVSHFLTYPKRVKKKLILLAKAEATTPSQWVKRRVMEAEEPGTRRR